MKVLIAEARNHFYERLFETNTLTLTRAGVASNADTSSRGSKAIAGKIVDILRDKHNYVVNTVDKISGQTLGKQFELLTMEFLQETAGFSGIQIKGLMTVAPYTDNPEENRYYFLKLKQLAVDIMQENIDNISMDILSMGMTGDYEVAIEEGATYVRVGTGIFGERNYNM